MHRISIRVADIAIDLTSPRSPAELGLGARLLPFLSDPAAGEPLRRIALRWEPRPAIPAPEGELVFDPGSIWKMYRSAGGWRATFAYPMDPPLPDAEGVLVANAAWDELTLLEAPTGEDWQSLLVAGAGELALRAAVVSTGGLVLHSSGIDDNGRGILFVAHSGIGKSTQLACWRQEPGVVPLAEDRNAVQTRGGPTCHATPWGGDPGSANAHAAPLSALILLAQAPENRLERLEPALAAPLVAKHACLPYWDDVLMALALENLGTILARVPVYRLHCRPGPETIALVRSAL